MNVKILGGCCTNCDKLMQNTKDALSSLGIQTEVTKVTDFVEIARYGVMRTPALVVNDKVLSFGKVLKTTEIEALLKKEV